MASHARGVAAARLAFGAAGVAGVGWGCWGLVHDRHVDSVWPVARWLVGVLVAHDAVVAPVTLLAGLALTRLLPPRPREIARGGLTVAAVVTLLATPLLLRAGASDNPTVLPLDYPRGLLITLGVVAGATALLALASVLRPGHPKGWFAGRKTQERRRDR